MKTRGTLVLALALWASGCDQEPQATDKVSLDWSAGEMFYVAASYKVATVKTTETPEALEDDREPDFGENWTDELVWTYQVVETGLVPTDADELFPYATNEDGTVSSLAVVRAFIDPSLNDDPDALETDPVIYLVFREDRDRLAAIVSFTNVDGERIEKAWSSTELGKSWSALSQSMLTSAPTYLAPFAAGWDEESLVLENGSLLDTVPTDDGGVDVVYDDELGGGLVVSRYHHDQPWPTSTYSDNLESRLMTDEDVEARRSQLPFLLPDPPEDFDYKAALAAPVSIDKALILDATTIADGWDEGVYEGYEPWAGSWWPLRQAAHVFGWRASNPQTNDTISDRLFVTASPQKIALEKLSTDISKMSPGAARDAKTTEYKTKQTAYVNSIVTFYDGILQGLQGGTIKVQGGNVTSTSPAWSYPVNNLSPFDKYALHMYLDGRTSPNPFYVSAWALLNSWAADPSGDNSWWGYCNGWSGAAILENEPRAARTGMGGTTSISYTVADQKGLTTALHYSTSSQFYGSRYYKSGDDITDLTPKAFHQIIQFYFRDQHVPLVFDTTADAAVWNFPAYHATVEVEETTAGGAGGKLNINTATAVELDTLNGIGPSLAAKIISYRTANGPFQAITDIQKVSGIGASTYTKFKDNITVTASARTFHVCAEVKFATDGVAYDHTDTQGEDPEGFAETYCYTLNTDSKGQVAGVGTWDDPNKHPDFAWIPTSNPTTASSGGSENPYLNYGTYLREIGDLRRQ